MPATPASQQLRTRAAALRTKAQQLDHALLRVVAQRAGQDTWIGPTADRFLADLRSSVNNLDAAVDGLRAATRRLERRADQLEAVAALATIPGGGPR